MFSSKYFYLIFAVVVLAIFSGVGYFANKNIYSNQTTVLKPTLTTQGSVTPTPTSTPDLTTDWQTYEDKEYGFSFSYPSEWSLNGWIVTAPGQKQLNREDKDGEFSVCIGSCDHGLEGWMELGKAGDTTLSSLKVKKQVYQGDKSFDPSITGNERLIIISGRREGDSFLIEYVYQDRLGETLINIFNQILSTFKFTK